MFKGKTIGVLVPAYNEERLIEKTLSTMPDFVDKIIVVNDASTDGTRDIIYQFQKKNDKIIIIDHQKNEGLGQSLIDGYRRSLEENIDITAVMAGDAQMDPDDLPNVLDPVVMNQADYVKGNRLLTKDVGKLMPKYRLIGNSFLTILTKFATGYWHIIDPQCGYTAISKKALQTIHIAKMTKGYGYNADILTMLNILNFRVKDVLVKPVYGEAKSRIRLALYIPKVSWLLTKLFFRRHIQKYIIRDFHPLIFFYIFAFILLGFICVPTAVRLLAYYFSHGEIPRTTLMIFIFCGIIGFQSLFFAMWLDMDHNKNLR